MRKHAGSWLIKLVLGAIVVVFVLWGVGSWTSQRSARVAIVNGDTISIEEYRTAYNRLLEQVRRSFGNNVTEEMIKGLQLPRQALDQLINQILVRQAAADLDLQISDAELARSIQSLNAFQTAGVFDSRLYRNLLDRNNLTPEGFEINQRDALLAEKLSEFLTSSVKVSDQEAIEWYQWTHAAVDLEFVLFEAERYPEPSPTVEEIQKFFEQHKESYKTEPELKIRYVKFEPKNYSGKVEIAEDDIQAYYEDHAEEFQTPQTVEARHILIKLGQNATPAQEAAARERIEKVLKMARDGRDFAELAKQYSEDPSKDKGGDLGSFTREKMVKPFADKAFSMKAGEISDPVRTQFGWHIIKVEKITDASTKSLADVNSDIRAKLTDERSRLLAYDAAESVYDAVFAGAKLEVVAGGQNVPLHTTDFFGRQGPEKGINNRAAFAGVAFDLPEGDLSEIQDFGDGYYIMEVVEKIPAQIPELKAVEQNVKADLIKAKKAEQAKLDAETCLSALKSGESLETAAKKFDLRPQSTGFFKRTDSIPNIGVEREISKAAFELSDQGRVPNDVIQGRKGYYVIKFRGRKTPPLEEFDKEKADIRASLLQRKKYQVFEEWIEQIKSRSEISIEEEFLKS
jgi:peptidyl-prolyl cis-trans isomerase D